MVSGGERFASRDPFSLDELRENLLVNNGIGPVFYRMFMTEEDSDRAVTWPTAFSFALCSEISINCPVYNDALCLIATKFMGSWRAAFKESIQNNTKTGLRISVADRQWITSSSQPTIWVDMLSGATIPELPQQPTSVLAINVDVMVDRLWKRVERHREQSTTTPTSI